MMILSLAIFLFIYNNISAFSYVFIKKIFPFLQICKIEISVFANLQKFAKMEIAIFSLTLNKKAFFLIFLKKICKIGNCKNGKQPKINNIFLIRLRKI